MSSVSNTQLAVKDKRNSNPGAFKSIVQRLGRGLMLPIAMLPVAGLFLGVGAGINNALIAAGVTNANAFIFGDVMKTIGDVIFANLPVLFAIAIAITYTNDAGAAALSAFVGWAVFNAVQTPFISAQYVSDGISYVNVAFYNNISTALITSNVGIRSMNTSVFGGIIVGGIVAGLYNKFYKIKLPAVIGFFSGVRFIPIITFAAATLLGLFFVIIWPIVALGIAGLGTVITGLPIGLNAFFFGIIERMLIPFGLHHVFYTPLWYTAAGGFLDLTQVYYGTTALSQITGVTSVQGDQSIWMFINSTPYLTFDAVYFMSHNPDAGRVPQELLNLPGALNYTSNALTAGYNPGQYMQGKFVIMIFGLPAATAAMIMAAKKEQREVAMSVLLAAGFTSFLTGITEPIEFTFLFVAPTLFFGFHAFMAGIAFWLMNILQVHVGLTFSGGLIDLMIYGLLPSLTSNSTHMWKLIVIGIVYIPIYYFVFYFWIVKKDIPTPGRTNEEVKLVSKAEYLAAKEANKMNKSNQTTISEKNSKELDRIEKLVVYLGGMDNLKTIDACATRLRLTVNDRDIIDDEALKQMGAAGIAGKGNNVQVIFGGEADILKSELNEIRSGIRVLPKEVNEEVLKRKNLDNVSNDNKDPLDSQLSRLEKLVVYLGGMDNLKTIDACATRLRLTVNNRDMINENGLKSLGAAGIAGKGNNVQVIFGGEADILKSELNEIISGKISVNIDEIQRQINDLNHITSKENPKEVQEKVDDQEKADLEAKAKAEKDDKEKEALEVKAKIEKEAKEKVALEAKTEKEAKEKVALEVKAKTEKEAKEKVALEAKATAEKEAKEKVALEAKAKTEKEVKEKVALEAKAKAEKDSKEKAKVITKDFSTSKELFEQKGQEITLEDTKIASNLIDIFGGSKNIEFVKSNITRISIKLYDKKMFNHELLKDTYPIKDIIGHNPYQIVWDGEIENVVKSIKTSIEK